MAQATRTPRLRGTTLVLLQSCHFLVGGRIPGPGGMCQLTPVTLQHSTPHSGYRAPQTICPNSMLDKPLLKVPPTLVGVHPRGECGRERWLQIGLLAWGVHGLETIPLPIWDGTRSGKQRELVSWADALLECSSWSSKCGDDLMIGQSGGWWQSEGWRQEDPKSRMDFFLPSRS